MPRPCPVTWYWPYRFPQKPGHCCECSVPVTQSRPEHPVHFCDCGEMASDDWAAGHPVPPEVPPDFLPTRERTREDKDP